MIYAGNNAQQDDRSDVDINICWLPGRLLAAHKHTQTHLHTCTPAHIRIRIRTHTTCTWNLTRIFSGYSKPNYACPKATIAVQSNSCCSAVPRPSQLPNFLGSADECAFMRSPVSRRSYNAVTVSLCVRPTASAFQ